MEEATAQKNFWDTHGWWLRELLVVAGLLALLAAVIYCSFAGAEEVEEKKADDEAIPAAPARTAAELYDQMRAESANSSIRRRR
mmetsp:Transcript_55165/g.87596  ORF Transcript_55165/g.87596 Transcript_55165/m.87596 type:complete len:84 (-) Transcript_55165:46-297(-)